MLNFLKRVFTRQNLLAASIALNVLGSTGVIPPVLAKPASAILGALAGGQ